MLLNYTNRTIGKSFQAEFDRIFTLVGPEQCIQEGKRFINLTIEGIIDSELPTEKLPNQERAYCAGRDTIIGTSGGANDDCCPVGKICTPEGCIPEGSLDMGCNRYNSLPRSERKGECVGDTRGWGATVVRSTPGSDEQCTLHQSCIYENELCKTDNSYLDRSNGMVIAQCIEDYEYLSECSGEEANYRQLRITRTLIGTPTAECPVECTLAQRFLMCLAADLHLNCLSLARCNLLLLC